MNMHEIRVAARQAVYIESLKEDRKFAMQLMWFFYGCFALSVIGLGFVASGHC